MFDMNLEYIKGILFVRIEGCLNKKTSFRLNDYLYPVILKHKIKYLVYNLYNLQEIDEKGIKVLNNIINAIKYNQGEAYMCEVPDYLKQTLRKVKVNKTQDELTAIELLKV